MSQCCAITSQPMSSSSFEADFSFSGSYQLFVTFTCITASGLTDATPIANASMPPVTSELEEPMAATYPISLVFVFIPATIPLKYLAW